MSNDTMNDTMAGSARVTPQVGHQLVALGHAIELLEKASVSLEARLSPVLSIVPKDVVDDGKEPADLAPLANRIRIYLFRVRSVVEGLRNIESCLEI